MMSTRFW